MRAVALAVAALIGTLSLIPFLFRWADWWVVRALDFPRVQLFALGVLSLGLVAWLATRPGAPARRWTLAVGALALAGVIAQGITIWPYTPLAPRPVSAAAPGEDGATLRMLGVNVLIDNREADRVVAQIRDADADVVVVTEPDAWWAEQLTPLHEAYPHRVSVPLDNAYGMIVLSRLPLLDAEVKYLVEPDVPSVHADVEVGGRRVALRLLHPRPPAPTEATETTERDAELLIVGRELARRGGPAVVAGDLNDVGWSATSRLFRRVSGLLDPRHGRGPFPTFVTPVPLLSWPLDHMFHTEHFELVAMRRLGENGSDHLPFYVALRLTPTAAAEQDAPAADAAEQDRATEQIEEVREP